MLFVIVLFGCKKKDVETSKDIVSTATDLPQVTTVNPKISNNNQMGLRGCIECDKYEVGDTFTLIYGSVILSSEVTFTDGDDSTKRGICWSESPNPTTNDQFYLDTARGLGVFSFDLFAQLKPSTKYYVRAFAENTVGKVYGNELNFTTTSLNPSDTTAYNITYTVADRKMLDEALANGEDLTKYCTSKVTNMSAMFNQAQSFNQDIGKWDVSNVTNMYGMFYEATSFNQDIGNWDVSNVTNMIAMFQDVGSFNQDLTRWCVTLIPKEPNHFGSGCPLTPANKPVWGTCPP